MKGIILAAGRGSRMGPLTEEKPKCLTRLLGRALLDWQIDALRRAGVDEIAVVSGYRAEMLQRDDLMVFTNARWMETNMVSSLMTASAWLEKSECVVSYSDIVYTPEIVSKLVGARGDVLITYDVDWRTLWERRFADPLSDAETFSVDEMGQLNDIGRRAQNYDEIRGQYMGLLKFTPTGWERVAAYLHARGAEAVDKMDMTTMLRGLIDDRIEVQTVPVKGGWLEVDSAADLKVYTEEFLVERGLLN